MFTNIVKTMIILGPGLQPAIAAPPVNPAGKVTPKVEIPKNPLGRSYTVLVILNSFGNSVAPFDAKLGSLTSATAVISGSVGYQIKFTTPPSPGTYVVKAYTPVYFANVWIDAEANGSMTTTTAPEQSVLTAVSGSKIFEGETARKLFSGNQPISLTLSPDPAKFTPPLVAASSKVESKSLGGYVVYRYQASLKSITKDKYKPNE